MDFSFDRFVLRSLSWMACCILLISAVKLSAQEVEHNYPVGPKNTDCDSMQLNGLSRETMIETIENNAFRFDQQFKISRVAGIRAGHYYSCDGKSGFLILTVGKEKALFVDVPKTIWDEFIKSSDLDGFYEKNLKNHYRLIHE